MNEKTHTVARERQTTPFNYPCYLQLGIGVEEKDGKDGYEALVTEACLADGPQHLFLRYRLSFLVVRCLR
jgi:hypothetical protein